MSWHKAEAEDKFVRAIRGSRNYRSYLNGVKQTPKADLRALTEKINDDPPVQVTKHPPRRRRK